MYNLFFIKNIKKKKKTDEKTDDSTILF